MISVHVLCLSGLCSWQSSKNTNKDHTYSCSDSSNRLRTSASRAHHEYSSDDEDVGSGNHSDTAGDCKFYAALDYKPDVYHSNDNDYICCICKVVAHLLVAVVPLAHVALLNSVDICCQWTGTLSIKCHLYNFVDFND